MPHNQTIDGVRKLAEQACGTSPDSPEYRRFIAAMNPTLLLDLTAPATHPQGEPVAQKYDDTLLPFVALMRRELHANAGKGDRPGWLAMSSDTCLLEIIYHFGKLQKAVKKGDGGGMAEYAADVANICMMLLDICGALAFVEQRAPVAAVTYQQVFKAYEYAEAHPHKYLRGTTNWCAAVAYALNAQKPLTAVKGDPGA